MKLEACRHGVAKCNRASDERNNRLVMRFATVIRVELVTLDEGESKALAKSMD